MTHPVAQETTTRKDSTESKPSLLPVAAVAVASLAVGAAVGEITANIQDNVPKLRAEQSKTTEALANAEAAAFTAALYDTEQYPKGVRMPVINGEIQITIKSGDTSHVATVKDPVLLATASGDMKPDAKGDFLKGAYYGVAGNDATGHVIITAVRYDSTNEAFKPYDPANIMLPNVGVYPTAVKGGPGLAEDALVGFDVTGETQLTNGDGSPVNPGLAFGMK